MSTPTESPGTAVPGNAPTDVSRQIAELTDAVNKLVQAQQQQPQPAPSSTRLSSSADIGGEISGGSALLPSVDTSRLSPLQQITLGLRDAKPVGAAPAEATQTDAANSLQGAD